jgi:hypothetical protein
MLVVVFIERKLVDDTLGVGLCLSTVIDEEERGKQRVVLSEPKLA